MVVCYFFSFLFFLSIVSTALTSFMHQQNDDPLTHQPILSHNHHDNNLLLNKADHQFSEFKRNYNKTYVTLEEDDYRFEVFMANLRRAKHHQMLDPTAIHGVTKFSDLTPSEFHGRFFFHQDNRPSFPDDVRSAPILPTDDLPPTFNWCNVGAVTTVKEQGDCKASWAFSAVGVMEGAHFRANHKLFNMSAQQLLDCDKQSENFYDNGCDGGFMHNAFEYILKVGGIVSDNDYPYHGSTVPKSCKFDNSKVVASISNIYHIKPIEDQIAANLVKHSPLAVFVNSRFLHFYTSGVSCPTGCWDSADHGTVLVGYEVDGNWIIKNSWGIDWGENGYFRICRGRITCNVDPLALAVIAKRADPLVSG